MIDISNEVFSAVSNEVRARHEGIAVVGENISQPAKLPCVAMDETLNIVAEPDFGTSEKFSDVTYRVQVFAASETGKRAQAREIFATVCDVMSGLNLVRKTYTTTPELYNASIYQITGTFEGRVRSDGMIFKR